MHHARATATALGGLLGGLAPRRPAHSVAAVTPARLTSALAAEVPGAVVESTRVIGRTSGTTDRTRLALEWNEVGSAAGLPASIFVKATAGPPKNRALAGFLDLAVNEVAFYRDARDAVPAVAPRAYLAEASRGGRFLLVLDDLEAQGCEMMDLARVSGVAYLEDVVDALASLHAGFWESPRLDEDLAWVRPQTRRAGFALETRLFRAARRARLRSGELPGELRDLARLLSAATWPLAEIWERGPLTLCHGDTHSGNSYRRPGGGAGFFDWQVAHAAHGMRDVAYFLTVSAPTNLRRAHERALIERYLAGLEARGVGTPTFDEAWARYRLYAVDGWDATAVTMSFAGLQERALVEASYALASQAVLDLDSLGAVRAALAGSLW
jgi:hypothetical protein